jgi:glycerol dehydrogenase
MHIALTPARYVQEPGALASLPEALDGTRRVLVVADDTVWGLVSDRIAAVLPPGVAARRWRFPGACTPDVVEALVADARGAPGTGIVGAGGGRALDLAKAAARRSGSRLVTVPTSAATCAATSNVAVLYEDLRYLRTEPAATPAACLVDPEIVGLAPARFLAAGMADALAKWEEGSLVSDPAAGDGALRLAARIAEDVHALILARGREAYADAAAGRVSAAVERILEANLLATALASCLGGARFRTAAAHAVYYGLTQVGRPFAGLHGEVVGYGLVVQALLLGREGHASALAHFLGAVGVPLTLDALGAPAGGAAFEAWLDGILRPDSSIHALPQSPAREAVRAALLEADALGRRG